MLQLCCFFLGETGLEQTDIYYQAHVYREIAEWNSRRLNALARNEPFTELFPEPPDTTH